MKQLGNLAIVCANRNDTLLQILNGTATVHVGHGPERTTFVAKWQDDEKIMEIIMELNHGRFRIRNGTVSAIGGGGVTGSFERNQIYDELSTLLTDYEGNGSGIPVSSDDLYEMLVKIQNNWEAVITASEGII